MSIFNPSAQQIVTGDGKPTLVMALWMQALAPLLNLLGTGTGGTGAGFTANGVLVGNGSSPITGTTPGTAGQVLTSNGASLPPSFQAAASSGITQLTGDVTAGPGSGSQAATIANDAVTFAKMQNIATQTLMGRDTAGTGDPESVTISQALDWLT